MRIAPLVFLLFFMCCCCCRCFAQVGQKAGMDKDIDAVMKRYLKREKTVGVEVGILKDDKMIYYSYGETVRGNGLLPDEHTIFEIGSITKTFTATLLARAVLDGRLKLDDPVNKWLPDSIPALAYKGTPVTLQTLANHSSGLPGNPTNMKYPPTIRGVWSGDPFKDYDDNDLFAFYTHCKVRHRPGLKNEYSNLGFGTLGVILERVYGKPFEQLVREEIGGPLGMADTWQMVAPGDSGRVAQGYAGNGQPAPAWHDKALAGCGALRSTAADLLKYARAQMGLAPDALTKAIELTHRVTWPDKNGGIGLAWNIEGHAPAKWIWHGGATGGYGCILIFNPGKKIALVMLANNPLGIQDMAGVVLGIIERDWP